MIDFKEKAEFLNTFLAKQCSLTNIESSLPADLEFLIQNHLSTLKFTLEDISRILIK